MFAVIIAIISEATCQTEVTDLGGKTVSDQHVASRQITMHDLQCNVSVNDERHLT